MNRVHFSILMIIVISGVLSNAALAASTPCPSLEVAATFTGDAVALASTGDGGTALETASAIPIEGGEWKAEKIVGATGTALTKYAVTPAGSEVVALLWHTLRSDSIQGNAATDGYGELKLRLVGPPDGPQSATVTIDIYRTILPSDGAQGSLNLDGTDYSLTDAHIEHEQQTYVVNVGDLVPTVTLVGTAGLSGAGSLVAQTMAVASVEPCEADPIPVDESDDPDDDETDPENEDECGGGFASGEGGDGGDGEGDGDGQGENEGNGEGDCPDDGNGDDDQGDDGDADGDDGDGDGDGECDGNGGAGDALHIHLTTGNIWTTVPIFRTYAAGSREFDLKLRYDSIRAQEDGPFGWGWTHSYNIYVQQVGNKVIYHEGNGRRNAFTWNGSSYTKPIGRAFQLVSVGGHFELHRTNGTVEVFDSAGRISEITDRRGRTTRFAYNGSGELEQIVSPHGRVVAIEWSGGRIWRIHHPDAQFTELTYNVDGELEAITDPLSHSVLYDYDTQHRVTKETLKNGKFYTAQYDDTNEINTIRDSLGNIVARVVGNPGSNIRLPNGRTDTITPGFLTYIDGRGNPWQIKRDKLARLRQRISPNGHVWKKAYGGPTAGNDRNRVTRITNERGHYRTFKWDASGNLIERRDEAGNLTQFEYHPVFRTKLTRRIEPDGGEWVYQYDPNTGDLLTIIDPLDDTQNGYPADAVVTFVYETYGEMEGVPPGADPLPGRIKKKIKFDRNGHATVLEYDYEGNLVQVTRGAGELDLITTYDHNAMGRTTRRVVERGDRQIITQWTYDPMGRLLDTIQDPGTPPANLNLVTSRSYDDHGQIETLTDPKGIVTKFEYDHRNRLKKRIEAFGTLNLTSEWTYDGNGNVETFSDPEQHVTTYEYNEQNFLTRRVDAEGYETLYGRDEIGNLTTYDRQLDLNDPSSRYVVSRAYDQLNRVVQRIVDPGGLNLTTTIEYATPACGCSGTPGRALPHRIIDPKGKYTYFEYDPLDRRTAVIRKVGDTAETPDSDDAVSTFEYDPHGNLTAVLRPEGEQVELEYDAAHRRHLLRGLDSVHGNVQMELFHDGAGNIDSVLMPNGNTVALDYDGANRLVAATDDLGPVVSLLYDENGNVVERSTAIAGQTWTFDYDDADRLWKVFDPIIEAPDKYSEFLYDDNGNRIETIDNNGIRTRYVYDGLDRLVQMIENYQGTDDTADTITTYGYNGARQVSISDHDGNTTNYVYDAALRLWKIEYPDNDPPGSGVVEYNHDPAGNVTWRKDQRGVETAYTYNDLHYLTGRSYAGTAPPRSETFQFDRSGRLKVADNDVAQLDFDYDGLGRLDAVTQTYVGGPAYTTLFDYIVATGDVRRIVTYASGRVVTETYDGRLRLDEIEGGPGVGADFAYDLADRRTGATLGNAVTSVLDFDLANRLTSIQHASQVADLFDVEYGYDAVGNRLFTRNLTPGLQDRSELYEYDQRHRLRRMDRGEVSGGSEPMLVQAIADDDLAAVQDWTILDRRGNWNEFAETIGVSPVTTMQTRSPNGVNEYQAIDPDGPGPLSPLNLAHDANGNVTLDPTAHNLGDGEGGVPDPSGQTYEYDEENRLTAVRRAWDNALLLEIEYDAVGRRVSSADYLAAGDPCGGPPALTRHVYAGLETLEEHLSCNGGANYDLARECIWGDRFPQPVALVTHGGVSGGFGGPSVPAGESVYHYLHDVLGSVVALTNAAGQVTERYTYDPYGKTVIEETNPATGLPTARLEASAFGNPFAWTGQRYDAGVRLYHFLFRGYSTHLGRWLQRDPIGYVASANLYLYALCDPLYWIDPLGLEDLPWWVKATDWIYPGNSAAEEAAFTDAVCTACEIAQLPADIATAGVTKPLKMAAKKAAKEGLEAAAEKVVKEGMEAAAEKALKEGAEKGAKKVADKAFDVAKGRAKAPKKGKPNSVYEQVDENGNVRSRTFYDENGHPFTRQDFNHPHGGKQPHEHEMGYDKDGRPNQKKTCKDLPEGYDDSPTEP